MILLLKVEIQHRGILEDKQRSCRPEPGQENHEEMFSHAFAFLVNNLNPRDPKHSCLSPMATVIFVQFLTTE